MMNNLVTVACYRDKERIKIHIKSLEKYLIEPVNHYIIINDDPMLLYRNKWEDLGKLYKRHKFHLIYSNWDEFNVAYKTNSIIGYRFQQVLKFWIFKIIQDDYIVLDSDCVVVKNTTMDDLKVRGTYNSSNLIHLEAAEEYCSYLNISIPDVIYNSLIPFHFEKKVLDCIVNYDEFLLWFASTKSRSMSEFLLYSLISSKYGMINIPYLQKIETLQIYRYQQESALPKPNICIWDKEFISRTRVVDDFLKEEGFLENTLFFAGENGFLLGHAKELFHRFDDCIIYFGSSSDIDGGVDDILLAKYTLISILSLHYGNIIFASSMGTENPSDGENQQMYNNVKIECEELIKNSGKNYCILKIPRVYGADRKKGLMKKIRENTIDDWNKEVEFLDIEDFKEQVKDIQINNNVVYFDNLQTLTIKQIKEKYIHD